MYVGFVVLVSYRVMRPCVLHVDQIFAHTLLNFVCVGYNIAFVGHRLYY